MGGPEIPEPLPPPTVRGPGLRTAIKRTFDSLDTYNYRLFFTGDLISHVGGWMQAMAEALLVYHLTHNGAAVGATFAFRFGPVLFFGLWGGMIADRFDRRRVMLVTQSLAAVLAAVLWLVVLTGVVQVWMLFAVAFLSGFGDRRRRARAAGVRRGDGRAGEVAECRRPQQRGAQLGSHHRTRARRAPHRDGRDGMGVLRERDLVLRGRDRAGDDA